MTFQGLDTAGGDNTAFVDVVAVNGVGGSGGSLVLGDNGVTVTGAGNTTISGQISGAPPAASRTTALAT